MTKSNLASIVVEASSKNYTKGRAGYKICKITPHHMAGVLTAKQCGKIFQNPERSGSSNYGIGNDGSIALYVDEENRAWTSSSRTNDYQAITIEVSNSSVGGDYPISDAAWNSLVNLCVDICKRYNFKLVYDETPNGSLTRHNMFANTICPGKYLQKRFPELAKTVNERLEKNAEPIPVPKTTTKYKVGDAVTINGVFLASNSSNKLNPAKKSGTITRVIPGALNPYLLNNGDIGWVNDSVITNNNELVDKPIDTTRKIGDRVTINGVYTSSTSTRKLTPKVKTGNITKIVKGALNPYLLNNGDIGWVNDKVITNSTVTTSKKTNEEIANEIIQKGLWGTGEDRKKNLENAGYDYNVIQKIINKKL